MAAPELSPFDVDRNPGHISDELWFAEFFTATGAARKSGTRVRDAVEKATLIGRMREGFDRRKPEMGENAKRRHQVLRSPFREKSARQDALRAT